MKEKITDALEIERKYIIKMPSISILEEQDRHTASDILQIYLPSESGETRRVRRRSFSDRVEYIETKKIRVDSMSSREIEREIDESEFNLFAENPLEGTKPILKTRHTFVFLGQLFEIDIYPEWQNTAIMETELPSRETQIEIPPFLEIIREVTGIKAYSNAGMSRGFPDEEM